jgi:HAD superfamily hydrolase (TIGR01549 family)
MPSNKHHIKAVLFDLDDTLWPVAPTIQRAEIILQAWLTEQAPLLVAAHSRESMRERRFALMEQEPHLRIDLWTLRHRVLGELLAASGEDPAKADGAMEVFARERNVVTLYEDVVPGLQHLGRHFQLGSISNGFADLGAIGLDGHFATSVAAHKLGIGKPDSKIFHLACEQLGVAPEEALYVGDDLQLDVQGAQRAGLRAVWMNRFARELPADIKPDLTCTSLHDLIAWLEV